VANGRRDLRGIPPDQVPLHAVRAVWIAATFARRQVEFVRFDFLSFSPIARFLMRRARLSVSIFLAAAIGLMAQATSAALTQAPVRTTTQLPDTVRPLHYDVAINPDAQALKFKGKVRIAIEVLTPTHRITLNAVDLDFQKVELTGNGLRNRFPAPGVTTDPGAETASFMFPEPVPKGRYSLMLDYSGRIATQAAGLFALDYGSPAGPKRALYTQFENSYARRVFPCWDEPAFRTRFALEAQVPTGTMAVSNMPVESTVDLGDGRTIVHFATTPPMSTYLLFFAAGEFERSTLAVDGTELGVITRTGATSQAAFALESTAAILREYNDYFGIKFPLSKLDNIAAPGRSQFFGAMENWGAILSFERAILLDPAISTQADRQSVFAVAAHEIAHQWFGNLVTMRWWDDLWLNEGFASWMESRTTRRLHPEWNTALAAVAVRENAMRRDALRTTHPVIRHVDTVDQIAQAFDSITYSKGEAVIAMLEAYVGADAWRDGVRHYLKARAYGNAVSDDLWREIEKASRVPVTAIAHDFTLQPGIPLIRVTASDCNAGQTTLKLLQTEFSMDQPDKKPLAWRVPVIVKAVGAATPVRVLMRNGQATVKVSGCGPVIVNAGQSGYYRTLYAPDQFQAIARAFQALPPIDQLGVMSDAWSLGLAGLQRLSDFLDLTEAARVDADPQISGKIASAFARVGESRSGGSDSIDDYFSGDFARRERFREFAIARLTPVFARAGWEPSPGEPEPVAILRNTLIRTLSALGDMATIEEARRRNALQAGNPAEVPAAQRKAILSVVARHANASTWEQLHALALGEKSALVRNYLYDLLASAEDEGLARRALELALTKEAGATNAAAMIDRVAGLHPDLAFDFAIVHLTAVNAKIDVQSRSRFFPRLASRSSDPAMIAKVKAYAAEHLAIDSRGDAETAAAQIAYRIKVRNERLPDIEAWLAKKAAVAPWRDQALR
jgi:aminopeptidase N